MTVTEQQQNSRKRDHSLELRPWRDSVPVSIKALEAAPDTKNVSLVWDSEEDIHKKHFLSNDLLASLLEFVGNELYALESLTIHFKGPAPRWTSALATPPISAITTLIATSETIQSLTLIGLQLLGDDDLDMNGFQEAIRIHPSLQSLVVQRCSFAKHAHLDKLKHVAYQRKRQGRWSWKHLDISENNVVVMVDPLTNNDSVPPLEQTTSTDKPSFFFSPLLSWCFYPITCCV